MPLTDAQSAEIAALRAQSAATARPTVPALEAMLYTPLEVLDHGFVRVIDYMGDDAAIVQAARVSYGRGTRRVSEDAGLIRYTRGQVAILDRDGLERISCECYRADLAGREHLAKSR